MAQTKVQLIDGRTSPLVFPSGNGTNGQYLQGDGAGALSWATLPAGGLTKTTLSTVSLSGATVTMTGISSTAQEISLFWENLYTASGATFRIRFGDSSAISTTNYRAHSSYTAGTSGTYSTTYVDFNGAGSSASSRYNGLGRIYRRGTGNDWFYVFTTSHENAPYSWQTIGTWNGTSGFDRIQFLTDSTSLSGGTAQITYLS